MSTRKGFVREVTARTVAARIGCPDKPRFVDSTVTVGQHKGFTVGVQFDNAYLQSLDDKRYWMRFQLQDGWQYRSVVRTTNGDIQIMRGLRGQSEHFSPNFSFRTDDEMEQILERVGQVIGAWEPD